MKRKLVLSSLLLVAASAVAVVTASAAGVLEVNWWTVDGGGASSSTAGTYSLGGTIGQPDAGPAMTGGTYSLLGGFMAGISAGVIPPGSVSISGNTTVGGAILSYDDGGPQTVTSNGNGHYLISVPLHWSGTVTPSKTNFIFTPDHRDYADLTSDQTGQGYVAEAQGPTIIRFYPLNGATACFKPQVGVLLGLADLVRDGNGSFDPSTVTLTLDSVNRTSAARISQNMTFPASEATILYAPTNNLSPGMHVGAFTYPTPGGPVTEQWTFTAAGITCPTDAPSEGLPSADENENMHSKP